MIRQVSDEENWVEWEFILKEWVKLVKHSIILQECHRNNMQVGL